MVSMESAANLVSMETAAELPEGWAVVGPSSREAEIDLHFFVKQRNVDELKALLEKVSSPTSPAYGQYVSNEKVHELTAPSEEDLNTVSEYLAGKAKFLTPNGDVLSAVVSVAAAEALVGCAYKTVRHVASRKEIQRCLGSYTLPAKVANAVDFVAPTVHIPGVRRVVFSNSTQSKNDNSTQSKNEPKTLRALYSVGDTVGTAKGNSMAVTAFLEQYYSEEDLRRYWSEYCDGIQCGDGMPTLVGDATTGRGGVESMLDIETITGVAGNVHAEFWGFKGRSPDNAENEPFAKW